MRVRCSANHGRKRLYLVRRNLWKDSLEECVVKMCSEGGVGSQKLEMELRYEVKKIEYVHRNRR